MESELKSKSLVINTETNVYANHFELNTVFNKEKNLTWKMQVLISETEEVFKILDIYMASFALHNKGVAEMIRQHSKDYLKNFDN